MERNYKKRTSHNRTMTTGELLDMIEYNHKIQRPLDIEHLENFKSHEEGYFKKYGEYSFLIVPIILCFYNNKYYLVDGQHRVEVIKYIGDMNLIIDVTIKNAKNEEHYKDIFYAINSNKKVELYDNRNNFKIMGLYEEYMRATYPYFIKNSKNPNFSNFNMDKLKAYFKDNNILEELKIDNVDILIQETESLNKFYIDNLNKMDIGKKTSNTFARLEKYKRKYKKIWLCGLFKRFEWVVFIINKITNKIEYKDMLHKIIGVRIPISKMLRDKVWRSYNGDKLDGSCYVCDSSVTYNSFECGHVISVWRGGETTFDNLKPICSVCNKSMETMNLETFKKLYHS